MGTAENKLQPNFLRRYREEVIRKRKAAQDIEAQLAVLEAELRLEKLDRQALPVGIAEWEQTPQSAAAD